MTPGKSQARPLSGDEQIDLGALAWFGRGDGATSDWEDLRKATTEARTGRTLRCFLGLPLLSDYLEEGLTAFGLSCSDFERRHL